MIALRIPHSTGPAQQNHLLAELFSGGSGQAGAEEVDARYFITKRLCDVGQQTDPCGSLSEGRTPDRRPRMPVERRVAKEAGGEWHLHSLYHFASSSLRAFSRGLFNKSYGLGRRLSARGSTRSGRLPTP